MKMKGLFAVKQINDNELKALVISLQEKLAEAYGIEEGENWKFICLIINEEMCCQISSNMSNRENVFDTLDLIAGSRYKSKSGFH